MKDPDRPGGVSARTLAAVLGALALVGVLLAGVAVLDRPASEGGATPPGPTRPATQPEPPSATTEPGVERATPAQPPEPFGTITEQVAALRGLDALRPVDAEILPADALADQLLELVRAELDVDELAIDQRVLAALGVIAAEVDVVAAIEGLYTSQILGVYVPDDDRLYVRAAGDELTPGERMTAAHEVLHALQDQHHDLGRLQDVAEDRPDAALAFQAVVEGDALHVEQRWAVAHLTEAERRDAQQEALGRAGEVPDVPRHLLATLAFPYERGAPFVAALLEHGGFDAVDRALARPPTTTAEIYHPQRYLDGVQVVEVAVMAPDGTWEELRDVDFGEFDLRELLVGLDPEAVDEAAAGWAGGQLRAFDRDGDTAVGIAVAFDDAAEAAEGCAALRDWLALADIEGVGRVRCPGVLVRAAVAPDADTADALVAG